MKKRQLFPGHVLASPSSFALPHVSGPSFDEHGAISDAEFGNINPIPFRQVQWSNATPEGTTPTSGNTYHYPHRF